MFEWIIRHGTLVAVTTLITLILGVVAVVGLPVQMIPDLDVRTITVSTSWPGATPQDVEKDILLEQEEYLRNVPNLRRMTSTARDGEGEIELDFPFDADMTETLIRVNNALSRVPSYPQNVDEPNIVAASFSANAFMYYNVAPLEGNPRDLDMELMRDFLEDNVRPRMEGIDGVSEVSVSGGAERQIQLHLQPDRMAARGVRVTDIRDAVNARNRDTSGGELAAGNQRYLLRTVGRFEDLRALEQLIVVRRGDSIVRLGDIADIIQDHSRIREASFINGRPVLGMQVRRESGANVIDIKRAMETEVAALNQQVLRPAGMRIALTSDDVRYVEQSIANVWTNLGIGATFATLVLFAFLRSPRTTLVAVMGVPICTIAAFLALMAFGRTVNVISLAGVAFAIGMTMDNSIVVLESIQSEARRGAERFRAAAAGVRRVWPAVLASTLTTVLVFLPILFIEEEAGQLYSDIAVAVSGAIVASMVVAITLIPTISARTGFHSRSAERGPRDSRWSRAILALVGWSVAGPWRRAAFMVGTLGVSLTAVILLTPPTEYLPEGEEPKTFATMAAQPGQSFEAMLKIAGQVEQTFLPQLDANPGPFETGQTDIPPLQYVNMSVAPERLRIISEPKNPAHIEALMDALTNHYETYPGVTAFASRGSIITSNDGGTRSINLDISGPRLEDVYAVARAARQRAEEIFDGPRIQAQPEAITLSQPLVEIHPDWDRAAQLGLSGEELGLTVAAFNDGAFLDEFFQDDDKIDIYAYGPAGPAAQLGTLGNTAVYTPQGATLPLASIVRIEESVDASTVRRVNGQRTVTLHVIPPREVALEEGVARVRAELLDTLRERGDIPRDVSVTISGASDQLDATRDALSGNFLVALAIIYLLLVAIFVHWGYPLLIMTAIPLGIAAGIVGLALLNAVGSMLPMVGLAPIRQPFDMISMLGFLILMGTVVNNPILIVHQARDYLRNGTASVTEAVTNAVSSRLRPIAMTTLTTACGLSPLVLIPGEGTELYRGVGAIVLSGLVGAAVVNLIFLPALTVTVLKCSEWTSR
ncbi:MAG: efflux RND transporter permease subunit [Aquisalimonadaceae bacterium]